MLGRSYISELTVFIIVKIPSLKDDSKSKLETVNNIDIKNYVSKIKSFRKYKCSDFC